MSESTIERVARAICEAEYGEGATIDTVHVRQARAAIEAMREPTEAMVDAGQWQIDPVALYQTFIDAAIAEYDTILKGEGR